MNSQKTSLIGYQIGGLLIAYLSATSRITLGEHTRIEVDRTELPRPYLGVALSDNHNLVIVADLGQIPLKSRVMLSIRDDDGNPIAATPRRSLRSLEEFPFLEFNEADQSRLKHLLLEKVPSVLPGLSRDTLLELRTSIGAAIDDIPEAETDGIFHDKKPLVLPPEMEGYLESVRGGQVRGWVWNSADRDTTVPVEIWVDGELIGNCQADQLRLDLRDSDIGDGNHAFQFHLPQQFSDGEPHFVTVRESVTGSTLKPGELEFRSDDTLRSHIDGLDGMAITGWVAREYPSVSGDEIFAWENGQTIAKGRADQEVDIPYGYRFRVTLPHTCFDGRIHSFVLRHADGNFLGELAIPVPYVLTPEDALRRYGGQRLRGDLMASASRRYESLRSQFLCLSQDETIDPATRARLKQIHAAHDEVILGFQSSGKTFRTRPHLSFPKVESPEVSVVIPVHNKFDVTYNCLASLIVAPNEASYEVIIVDDGSSDETLSITDFANGIKVLRNETSQGFVRSCNRGGKAATGRYIVMLNNDVEVGPCWIDELLRIFDEYENVGMSGAKLLYPDGTLQEAGGIVWNTGDPWNYGRGANARDPRYNYVRDTDYLSGACIMLPKPLWDELEGFDLAFAPAYFEDTDLAFRVREKGYRTVYAPFCEIVHFEGVSCGTSTSSGTKRYQEINRPKFKQRHAAACRHNGAVGADVELNKDRNIRYRALVIDVTTPRPDQDAGSYAAIQEMRLLQSFGIKLTFIPENAAYLGEYTERLQRMGVECLYAPFALTPYDVLQSRGREFDIVFITRYTVAEKFIDAVREFAPQAKILFNNADLHFLRELRAGIASRSEDQIQQALRTRDAELSVMRRVDVTLSYNEVEHAVILSHNLSSTRIAKCPWVVELPENVPSFHERRDIAFLGSYGHPPNAEAVEAFVAEVMPLLRRRLPGVRFLVYGSNPPDSFASLEADDIVIKGWVKDVAEVYDTCRVFIAPLKTGAGLKGKVVGALAHGVPCVLSPIAAEGVGLRKDIDALIATKPEEWAKAIAELYENESRWLTASRSAREFTASEYSFERGRVLISEALSMIGVY